METSVSLMERLAGSPTDDDWRRLELFEACGHFVQTDSTPAGILESGERQERAVKMTYGQDDRRPAQAAHPAARDRRPVRQPCRAVHHR